MSRTQDLVDSAQRHWLPVYKPRRIVLDRGQGARVHDLEGRDYIDFASGIAVTSLGHGDPDLQAALAEQAGKLWHASNVFHTEPPIRLAEELIAACAWARRVFLCNSGTEANEAVIKLVRRWATAQGRPPERRGILSFRGSFHGRTLAAVTATAQPKYQEGFEPLPPGFHYLPFNDEAAVEAALAAGEIAAVLVEPVQGEGGVVPAAPGFLRFLREACDRHGALLVLDEIQCGMGRTGELFAHSAEGVVPDAMSLAKALGCGFPIGALLVGDRLAETLGVGAHGTTFGGNPMAAAVACVALRKLGSAEVLGNVRRQSTVLRDALQGIGAGHGLFSEVRGRGLMLGAVLAPAFAGRAGEVLDHAADAGLLLLQAGPDVLRFLPPLTLSDAELAEGLARLAQALKAFLAGPTA